MWWSTDFGPLQTQPTLFSLTRSSHETPSRGAVGRVLARKSRRSDRRRAFCTLRIGSATLTQSRARHTAPQQVAHEKSGLITIQAMRYDAFE